MLDQSTTHRLEQFTPINELSPERLALIGEKVQISELPPKKTISACDQCKWYLYVIDGSLIVTDNLGHTSQIVGGSSQANVPLFEEPHNNQAATTASTCRIARLERQLFETLLNEERLAGYEVNDVQVSDSESELFEGILAASNRGELGLPAMPEVALKIVKLADDPDAGLPALAKVVQIEPTVAGTIIKAANSPLYRGSKPVDNIKNAVVRLGAKITRNLATSVAMRERFSAKTPLVKKRMQQLWEHSVHTSALSFVIARETSGFDAERALMAGLLHDIGVIPILNHVDNQKLDPSPEELEATIKKLRAITGVLVINDWGLDKEFVTVIEEADDWLRDPAPEPDYCDVVLFAQLCAAHDHVGPAELPALQDTPAYQKLNRLASKGQLGPDIVDKAEPEITNIKQLLNG
jgi:HD-like signal output (HDOD) protein